MTTKITVLNRSRAAPLGWLLILLTLGTPPSGHAADLVRIGGTGSALGAMKHVASAFQRRNPDIAVEIVPSLGSAGGINAVTAGAIDLGLSGRPLADGERKLPLAERELARTPLVFATHARNPATRIARSELEDIHNGTRTAWPDGSAMRLILRPLSDSETVLARQLSPEMALAIVNAHARPGMHVAISDQDAANALERNAGAIGTSTLSLIVSERRRLKPLTLDGRAPSVAALATGEYPYYKPLHVVTQRTPTAPTRAFLAFLDSPEGRRILTDNGYYPLPRAR